MSNIEIYINSDIEEFNSLISQQTKESLIDISTLIEDKARKANTHEDQVFYHKKLIILKNKITPPETIITKSQINYLKSLLFESFNREYRLSYYSFEKYIEEYIRLYSKRKGRFYLCQVTKEEASATISGILAYRKKCEENEKRRELESNQNQIPA